MSVISLLSLFLTLFFRVCFYVSVYLPVLICPLIRLLYNSLPTYSLSNLPASLPILPSNSLPTYLSLFLFLFLSRFLIPSVSASSRPPFLTSLSWYQKMKGGGSGLWFTMQVRLMVEPELTWRSGPPNTRVSGSGREEHSFGVPGSWVEVLSSYFGILGM